MTAETLCGYPGRDEVLVSYLYADLDPAERSTFDTHLVLCARCRGELAQLQGVRQQLAQWTAPSGVSHQPPMANHPSGGRQSWWRDVPAWAQVAAALLCVGIGAGLANLDVRYDQQGLSVRTGWLKAPTAQATAAARTSVMRGVGQDSRASVAQDFRTSVAQDSRTSVAQDFSPADSAPWRADLIALERQLRTEFRSADAAAPDGVRLTRATQPSLSEAELLKRVRALVDESERKQNRELALRVGEMVRSVNAQRQADLRKIDQSLGLIQSNTGVEVLKQRQLLNYLVRVSAQK